MITDGSLDKCGLEPRHPLVAFCREPNEIGKILALDDTCVSGAYSLMCDASDHVLSSLASRLRDRKRLKCIDIRHEIERSLGWETASDNQQDVEVACKAIESKVQDWLVSRKDGLPSILIDNGVRVPYREYDESKGPLNQIRIRVTDDPSANHIDIRDRSKIVRAIDPFKFNRLYIDNDESEKFVHGIIVEEIKNVKGSKAK